MTGLVRAVAVAAAALGVVSCGGGQAPGRTATEPRVKEAAEVPVRRAATREEAAPAEARRVAIRPAGTTLVLLAWDVPAGTKLNGDAPYRARWVTASGLRSVPEGAVGLGSDIANGLEVVLEPEAGAAEVRLAGFVDLVVCDEAGGAVCLPARVEVDLKMVTGPAPPRVRVQVGVPGVGGTAQP